MRFPIVPVDDLMGEVFTPQDFECLAFNIQRQVRERIVPGPLRVVELGTWSGQSTLAIARTHVLVHCLSSWHSGSAQNSPEKFQWVSDRLGDGDWDGADSPAFRQFLKNTNEMVFRTAMPCPCDPYDAAFWWTEKLDAIFINNDINATALATLIHPWVKHVRSGGIIYGVYKDHTVSALTGLGSYTLSGTIWRLRVAKESVDAMGA